LPDLLLDLPADAIALALEQADLTCNVALDHVLPELEEPQLPLNLPFEFG
jgi:hypothetical protein